MRHTIKGFFCASLLWSFVALGDAIPGCKTGERMELNPIPPGATNHSGGHCVPLMTNSTTSIVLFGMVGVTILLGLALFFWIRRKENQTS